jgi:plastocyanin
MLSPMRCRRLTLAALALAVVAAACSDDADPETRSQPPGTFADDGPVQGAATAAGLGDPESDAAWPDGEVDTATGAVGFSRYVYAQLGDEVAPFLLEGPATNQSRCQEVELPCSYLDLKELHESGDAIPPEVDMTAAELGELVAQLDELSAVLTSLETIDDACAAGYAPYTTQWPNMGVHLRHPEHATDGVLDPARPDVVMFARPGGESTPLDELGTCDEGSWTGDSAGYEVVGSAFYLPLDADHPDGFAGPIDNWHIHFNSCGGSESSGAAPVTEEECRADGGTFFTIDPQWMIHAYAVPTHDNQSGVFSMWNPSVSPVSDPVDVETARTQLDVDGAVVWSINDFALGDLNAEVGQPIVFGNSDAAPHTITSRDGLFDSGLFGSGGSYEISFDEPGSYQFFCTLHPSMTGSVTVG